MGLEKKSLMGLVPGPNITCIRFKLECLSLASLSSLVCLWVRPGAYLRMEHLKGTVLGLVPALLSNIRLGWKRFPGTNNPAYFVKKFYNTGQLDVTVMT